MSHPDSTAHLQYHVPAVRHLAWMCHAPQLISSALDFAPEKYLPEDVEERLKAWDNAPQCGPAVLTEQPPRRLGHYFERLYECLIRDLLGWEVLLKNQPIRNNGMTLGELDFVVRDPADNTVEHHEIAVKFYLGHRAAGQDAALWYGPNSRDRLDIKTRRLISHQSRMSERPETRGLLASMGVEAPSRARIFMPGYLFYPLDKTLTPPADVPSNHLRGDWLYIDELEKTVETTVERTVASAKPMIPLVKPHWLGPWRQKEAPDCRETESALAMVRSAGIPRLFAAMEQSPVDGYWQETSRLFVVPTAWPVSSVQN